ncbi:MAG: hypothetical protein RLZZ273_1500 [Bacteroidota bacterium]
MTLFRSVRIITNSIYTGVGPLRVAQPLPVNALRGLDPFILLHHAGPQRFDASGEMHRIDPHPHRGFEPVTFVYRGSVHHKDSLGNSGVIHAGEVQWITSGSGIIHSEGPTPELQRSGAEVEIIQLWVNLPASDKLCQPSYQEIRKADIPAAVLCDGQLVVKVVSGSLFDVAGPATTHSVVATAMGSFTENLDHRLQTPRMSTFAIYVLNGSLVVNDQHRVERHQLVVFDDSSDQTEIVLRSEQAGDVLILAGEPIGEPVVQYGPFVMNTEEEIHQAIEDYRNGRMGYLDS